MRGNSDSPSTGSSRRKVPSRKNPAQRGLDDLLGSLAAGDRLIVSELSLLGRSLGQVIRIVDE